MHNFKLLASIFHLISSHKKKNLRRQNCCVIIRHCQTSLQSGRPQNYEKPHYFNEISAALPRICLRASRGWESCFTTANDAKRDYFCGNGIL